MGLHNLMAFGRFLPVGIHCPEPFGHAHQKLGIQHMGYGIRGQYIQFTDLVRLFVRPRFDFDDIFAIPGVKTNTELRKLRVGYILNETHFF